MDKVKDRLQKQFEQSKETNLYNILEDIRADQAKYPKVNLKGNSFLSIPEQKGLTSFSGCCGVEMEDNIESDICPSCKEHTSIVWADEEGEEVPNEVAWYDPYEDNTYN